MSKGGIELELFPNYLLRARNQTNVRCSLLSLANFEDFAHRFKSSLDFPVRSCLQAEREEMLKKKLEEQQRLREACEEDLGMEVNLMPRVTCFVFEELGIVGGTN